MPIDYGTLPSDRFQKSYRKAEWRGLSVFDCQAWELPKPVKSIERTMTCFADYGTTEDYFIIRFWDGDQKYIAFASDEGAQLGKWLSESDWRATEGLRLSYDPNALP